MDALGRSYLLDALDSTIELVNQGIRALQDARTTHDLHAYMLRSQVWEQL